MFEPFPDRGDGFGLYSTDVIREEQVSFAIKEAEKKEEEAEACYQNEYQNAPDEVESSTWALHECQSMLEAADMARITAVLLTAMHLEGAVNFWGVFVVGEDFFKDYLERGSISTKIALITALSGNGRIPRRHQALTAVQDLFERRNQIAHRKTKEERTDTTPELARAVKSYTDLTACKTALGNFRQLLLNLDPVLAASLGYVDNNPAIQK